MLSNDFILTYRTKFHTTVDYCNQKFIGTVELSIIHAVHYVLYIWTINLDSGGMENVWFLCVHGNTYMVPPTTTITKIISWL